VKVPQPAGWGIRASFHTVSQAVGPDVTTYKIWLVEIQTPWVVYVGGFREHALLTSDLKDEEAIT
jgi:hypothetical protein